MKYEFRNMCERKWLLCVLRYRTIVYLYWQEKMKGTHQSPDIVSKSEPLWYEAGNVTNHWDSRIWVSHRPDGGGSKDLWNVGKLLPDYTAQQSRRQPSSPSTTAIFGCRSSARRLAVLSKWCCGFPQTLQKWQLNYGGFFLPPSPFKMHK
jgi:hypothetical protein